MRTEGTPRKGRGGAGPGTTGGAALRASKGPLTAVALAFIMAMVLFLPMTSGVASASVIRSEGEILWADNLGSDAADYFNGIAAAPDGGFAAVGMMNSTTLTDGGSLALTKIGTGGTNTVIIRYDQDGNILWGDNLGGDGGDYFTGVAAAPDGGFVAVGDMNSSPLMNGDGSLSLLMVDIHTNMLIVKYDADGNIEWADNLGGDSSSYFYGVVAAPDGGFVAVGSTLSSTLRNIGGSLILTNIDAGNNAVIVKYDADGNIEWADNLGGNGADYFYGVTAAADGSFVAVGYMSSPTLRNGDGSLNLVRKGPSGDGLIVKYDADGNIVWGDNLGKDNYDYFTGVAAAPDGGFVTVGYMSSSALTSGSMSLARIGPIGDGLVVKYDADGNIVWGDNLGGDGHDYLMGVATAPAGGFVVAGYMSSSTLRNSDGSLNLTRILSAGNTLIVKYYDDGSIEWGDNLGGDSTQNYFYGVAAAPGGGYAAAGYFDSSVLENRDGSLSLAKIGSSSDLLIVKYYGRPPVFPVIVKGNGMASWSVEKVTYGDADIEITFVTEPGYHIEGIVSVFMGTKELTEGIDYVFEDGVLKIPGPVTGRLLIEVKTSSGGGGEETANDLWWVLIASLTALSLLLLLGFIIARRVKIAGTITVNGEAAAGAKVEYIERTEDSEKQGSVISDKDGKYTIYTKIDATVTITSVSKGGMSLGVRTPAPILVEEAFTEAHIG